jgi:RNA polymerase sigma-70 factor (ECF subfamily)
MLNRRRELSQAAHGLARLLAATAQQDQAAFRMLYHATSAKLFGVVLAICGRRDLAEDVLQEAYVRIWFNAARYDPCCASPITWMVTIARNLAIDARRRSREPASGSEPELLALPDLEGSGNGESNDEQRALAALNALDPMKRGLVIAAYVNGESREQLARRLGAPIGTVKSWLRRALLEMRANIDYLDLHGEHDDQSRRHAVARLS